MPKYTYMTTIIFCPRFIFQTVHKIYSDLTNNAPTAFTFQLVRIVSAFPNQDLLVPVPPEDLPDYLITPAAVKVGTLWSFFTVQWDRVGARLIRLWLQAWVFV
jgi:hypothetical protein